MPKTSEHKLEYMKQYHQDNKEQRNEMRNRKVECGCGSTFARQYRYLHIKTPKHLEFVNNK